MFHTIPGTTSHYFVCLHKMKMSACLNVRHCMCVSLTFMVASLVLSIYSVEIGDSQDKGDTNVLYNESISTPPSIYTCPGPPKVQIPEAVCLRKKIYCEDMLLDYNVGCAELMSGNVPSSLWVCQEIENCKVCCS